MEIGMFISLAVAGLALGWFWVDGVVSGERRMRHRP
jgi:hypothetical protein